MYAVAVSLLLAAPAAPPKYEVTNNTPVARYEVVSNLPGKGVPVGYHAETDATGARFWVRDGWSLAKPAAPAVAAPRPFPPAAGTRDTPARPAAVVNSVSPGSTPTVRTLTGVPSTARPGDTDNCPPGG